MQFRYSQPILELLAYNEYHVLTKLAENNGPPSLTFHNIRMIHNFIFSLVNWIVIFVIGAECDESAERDGLREEHLRRCIHPRLRAQRT